MKVHILEREQWIPGPLDRVFAFFSEAGNLEAITPGWLGFRILTPLPIEMRTGTRIEYRIRLAGVPVSWHTRITRWELDAGFVDEQERGPYALWQHAHTFRPMGGGVLMADRVRYALPWGPFGALAHAVAVRSALAAIFDFRFRRVAEHFAADRTAASDGNR